MHGLNENSKAIGDNIILRNVEHDPVVRRGGIELPESYARNHRVGKAEIVSIGGDVPEYFNKGDIVVYDLNAIYGDKIHDHGTYRVGEYVILSYDAIIYKVEG